MIDFSRRIFNLFWNWNFRTSLNIIVHENGVQLSCEANYFGRSLQTLFKVLEEHWLVVRSLSVPRFGGAVSRLPPPLLNSGLIQFHAVGQSPLSSSPLIPLWNFAASEKIQTYPSLLESILPPSSPLFFSRAFKSTNFPRLLPSFHSFFSFFFFFRQRYPIAASSPMAINETSGGRERKKRL